MTAVDHLTYGAAWLGFAIVHSATAGASRQTGLGQLFGRWHRLAYNALAMAQVGGVLAIGVWAGADSRRFALPGGVVALQYLVLGIGAALAWAALRAYRAGPFIGLAQLGGEEDDAQPLVTNALHRHMRHPLYTALLFLLWGAVHDELSLATAIWGSLYLFIGSIFEERRLVTRYGSAYRVYRETTRRFVPRLF